jgi:hypothetical protein
MWLVKNCSSNSHVLPALQHDAAARLKAVLAES